MVKVYVVLLLILNDSVLLLKRENTGFGDGLYSFSGGGCEQDETPTNAVIREAQEELGVAIKLEDLELVHTLSRNGTENNLILLFFKASKWRGEVTNKEPNKHSELLWAPMNLIPDNMISAHKQALDAVKKNILYSEHGW